MCNYDSVSFLSDSPSRALSDKTAFPRMLKQHLHALSRARTRVLVSLSGYLIAVFRQTRSPLFIHRDLLVASHVYICRERS